MLEHWSRALHGEANLVSPNFFYPEKRVLGNSDTLLGLGVPYAVLRSLGVDRYVGLELVMMLVTVVGFVGIYRVLQEVLQFARSTALIGASLFIISNMYYIDLAHVHLNFVVVAPWLFVFASRYWRARGSRPGVARAWICMFGLLLALLLYTTYYEGWFFVLCGATGVAFYLACTCFAENSGRPVIQAVKEAKAEKWNLLLGGLVFLLALVPFFLLYIPSLHRTGRRALDETLYYIPRPLGMLDVGRDNWVWGRMSARIQDYISPGGIHEHPTGWPLLTIVVFLASALYCGLRLLHSRREKGHPEQPTLYVISAIALTCLTLWTAGVKVGEYAPVWTLLWKYVPGAAAIRVPQRINLVLNIGVLIVCMFGFETLRKKLIGRGALAYLVPALLVAGLAVEQLNFMKTHLISRTAEAQKFARVPPPPKECSAFYISNWSSQRRQMLSTQTDAMLLAQQYGIPTLDGYSSWFPEGWSLITAARGRVDEEASEWARLKGLSKGVCALDMNRNVWSPVDVERFVSPAYLGDSIAGKIANPGFEASDLALWPSFQAVHAAITRAQVHGGLQSLAESEGGGSVYQDLSGLEPGRSYRLSAWVAASPGTTAGAQIALFDVGASKPFFSKTLHTGTNWQLLSDFVPVTRPGTVRVHLFRTEGTGTIYWDDVRLYLDKATDESDPKN